MKHGTTLLTLLILAAAVPAAEPIPFGDAHTLDSAILGEERTLNVLLPLGYAETEDEYPVILLLDGAADQDWHHVAGLVRFLDTYQLMPPSILVGVGNTDRRRDMTYPSDNPEFREWAPTHGGSAAFRRAIEEEFLPYVEEEFRASGHRTLVGQSLAGLFATEFFVEQAELFDEFIIVSPSLWWDDYSLVPRLAPAIASRPDYAGVVCIAVGSEGAEMEGPVHAFAAALASEAPPTLRWHFLGLPAESHATILHRALYQAFERIHGEAWPGMGRAQ